MSGCTCASTASSSNMFFLVPNFGPKHVHSVLPTFETVLTTTALSSTTRASDSSAVAACCKLLLPLAGLEANIRCVRCTPLLKIEYPANKLVAEGEVSCHENAACTAVCACAPLSKRSATSGQRDNVENALANIVCRLLMQ